MNLRKLVPYFVGLGLILAYLKTAEVMIQFSPRAILGVADPMIPYLWAYLAALLVEGLGIVAYSNLRSEGKDRQTVGMSKILLMLAILFSGSMNLLDQNITDGRSIDQASSLAGILRGVITLIPLIVVSAITTLELTDRRFPDNGGRQSQPARSPLPSQYDPAAMLGPAAKVRQIGNAVVTPNGHGPETVTQFSNDAGRLPNLAPRD